MSITRRWSRLVGGIVIAALSLSGCSQVGADRTSGALSATGEGRVKHADVVVELAGSAQEVTLAPPALDREAHAGLRQWLLNGFMVGTPVDITLDGDVPPGGITLTRTYPVALPNDVSVAFAYWDEEVGEWQAVPSTIAADRLSVSATVDHLSIWDTFVTGSQAAVDGFRDGLAAAGQGVADAASSVYSSVQDFNAAVRDTFVSAGETGFYLVGKVFDVRVDAPVCESGVPDWVESTIFIETDRNNPILWCAGHDPQNPDLLVVRARVNRGYGSFAVTAATPTWTHNSTYDQGLFDAALAAITDLDSVLAQSVAEITGGGTLVAPGQEISFGFDEQAVRSVDTVRPLVHLTLPGVTGFFATSLAQLAGIQADLMLEGSLAALIGVASCSADIADSGGDVALAGKAALTCLRSVDDDIARRLAVGYLRAGRSPAAAGRAAGSLVGKISVGLVAIGPAFSAMNYVADSNLVEAARTLTAFVRGAAAPDGVPQQTGPGEYTIWFDHPSWGRVRLITTEPVDNSPGPVSITVVDAAGVVRFSYLNDFQYVLEPLGIQDLSNYYGSVYPSPGSSAVDAQGHIFLDFNPGRYNGVIVLAPIRGGFEDFETLPPLPDGYGTRFYYAVTVDVEGDGTYEVQVFANDCDPDCATGTVTSQIHRWTGTGYAP